MPRIVTIQFSPAGKLYDFNAGSLDIAPRDRVVVETERGIGVATVVRGPLERDENPAAPNLVTIKRKATQADLDILQQNARKEKEAYEFCSKRIMERSMQMKLVQVEYLFDGSKAVFYFTADGRVDFRDLVKDLAHTFHTRIEMRQIGVRDESKMVGGIGICGRELCCSSWLREFQPVSVKMAKEQSLALNPNKISGQCGRLLCCLDYEYETYCCLRKTFPKYGKRVRTDTLVGTVDKMNILTGNITLKLDDGKLIVVKKMEITGEVSAADMPPPRAESAAPAGKTQQRGRERRPERPHSTPSAPREEKAAAPAAAPAQPAAPLVERQPKPGKKKHRSRKHGHRKPNSGAAPEGGSPAPPKE